MTTKFSNKKEYLQFRKEWKAEYKRLSQEIRDAKFSRWYCSLRRKDKLTPERHERWKSLGSMCPSYWEIQTLKALATNMIEQLKEAKAEAQRQYLASKTQNEMIAI